MGQTLYAVSKNRSTNVCVINVLLRHPLQDWDSDESQCAIQDNVCRCPVSECKNPTDASTDEGRTTSRMCIIAMQFRGSSPLHSCGVVPQSSLVEVTKCLSPTLQSSSSLEQPYWMMLQGWFDSIMMFSRVPKTKPSTTVDEMETERCV